MMRGVLVSLADRLGRLRGGRRLVVLIFHRVLPAPDPMYPYDPDVRSFAMQMQALAEDFNALPLGEAIVRLRHGDLPDRAVAITFDDGYADNDTQALPVLQRWRLPATFFIASGYLDGGCMFNDAVIEACRRAPAGTWSTETPEFGKIDVTATLDRAGLAYRMLRTIKYLDPARRKSCAAQLLESAAACAPTGLMMTRAQLRHLHEAGMAIGAHTRNHPILANLSATAAEREIAEGRDELRGIIGAPVDLFAYPNGRPGDDYGQRDVALVRRLGFAGAVSTASGCADARTDPLQVPRISAWGASAWRFSGRVALACAGARGSGCDRSDGDAGN